MLGQAAVLDDIPYFYTDQFDLGMEYSGYASLARNATLVLRGDPSSRKFIAFWVTPVSSTRGTVVAGMNVNVWDVQDDIKFLITTARAVRTHNFQTPPHHWAACDETGNTADKGTARSEGSRIARDNHVQPALLHPVHRFGSRIIDFRRQAALMAIINRTPDSFYDTGRTFGLEAAIDASMAAVAEGADWIDVGGQPFAQGPA